MHKLDIARRIHQEVGISEGEAVTLLEGVLELLKTTLQQGEPISIMNFGIFTVRNKASRRGRNPRTGEEIVIAPRRIVTFRASTHFKSDVNSIKAEQHEAIRRTA